MAELISDQNLQDIQILLSNKIRYAFPGITSTALKTRVNYLSHIRTREESHILAELNTTDNKDSIISLLALLQDEIERDSSSSQIFNSPF